MLEIDAVYLGNCLDVLKSIDDNTVDFVLCDPPYGTTSCKWDIVIPLEPMWEHLKRVCKPHAAVCIFGQEPFSSILRLSNLAWYKYDWVWKKSNPSNIALANKQPMRYHEIISVFYAAQPTYNKQMIPRSSPAMKQAQKNNYTFHNKTSEQTSLKYIEVCSSKYSAELKNPSSVLEFSSLRPNAREFVKHPTQKPVALAEYLIKTYTNKGDIVLDFATGSGTFCVAAKNLGRHFIGIENDLEYFKLANKRIEEDK